jgi:hypothetical protein
MPENIETAIPFVYINVKIKDLKYKNVKIMVSLRFFKKCDG